MTYRNGAFVVDTREGWIGQVIDSAGSRVHVRAPGGGAEWEVPFSVLRLATREERDEVGLWPRGTRSRKGCPECPALELAWRDAAEGGDKLKEATALVALRRHGRVVHMLPGGRA
ncbi:hypothetical protein AB0H73_18970 [Streptomyces olivoreticuli]|uniref:hypothetical protein n=1 Tax=Streptomyces olivoreticuli TaxID=68246 RepID=UPI000E27C5B7|nr:hypothetical protein [Streptomyces olivoreticuli]